MGPRKKPGRPKNVKSLEQQSEKPVEIPIEEEVQVQAKCVEEPKVSKKRLKSSYQSDESSSSSSSSSSESDVEPKKKKPGKNAKIKSQRQKRN
jgi:hypothetical protein